MTPPQLVTLFSQPIVSIGQLKRLPCPVIQSDYLAIGGGMGSFTWVDYLRICGATVSQIVVVGLENRPYGRLNQLCYDSQIRGQDRMRSNSDACPDNLWGFPSYAVREIAACGRKGDWQTAGRIIWQLFSEPTLTESYTPTIAQVFHSLDREAQRIGWGQLWRYGQAYAIRRSDDGRYVVGVKGEAQDYLVIAPYVHLAVGYPAIHLLPELQNYREQTGDQERVVNSYEPHEHVYDHLRRYGGTVLIRGRGMTASKIVENLASLREYNRAICILHLVRSPLPAASHFGRSGRISENHWEYQPFNWPKSAFGGTLRDHLAQLSPSEREPLFDLLGGTTTAPRPQWRELIARGLKEGWYQLRFGQLQEITRPEGGGLQLTLSNQQFLREETRLWADFVIDCTGLEAKLNSNPLLADLINSYHIPLNKRQRLPINEHFELTGLSNGSGRLFAAGSIVFGNAFAPTDSFFGMQYGAYCSLNQLLALKAPGLKPLTPLRSVNQWWLWMRGLTP